ncbi:HAD family hydrolase [Lichenifustis flavocetrariae]|uniref:HAD family phosphatase n=1 Tax=Lichenifustis flavocetrariae TaxID=2949735 RepID=A0AA42CL18_9HYPH|nr:HAD family phosphatase [Lichenifustis flavocetrariae]MCW6506932.1 HAD family phosphatase [Lichenifustis flavocetrariae]
MTALRAVAWDVDGTLVDSEPLHLRALLAASRGFGVDLSDLRDDEFRGVHMPDVWRALRSRMPADLQETVWLDAIAAHYIGDRATLRPLPGAVETIAALAARGIPQACVSNSHRAVVNANLDALGITRFMAFTIALDDVSAGKPDPEPYAAAARLFGLAPYEVLAVEDSVAGMTSAVAAGLPVAFFTTHFDASIATAGASPISRLADIFRWF